tara:strand:- start:705 stop:1229 length:525 start_codon:yes stop_codon:yes gene_type:complete
MSDFDGLEINMEEVEKSSTIPEGEYPCIIKVCEKTLSAAGNEYLKVEIDVTGDKYAGWKLRSNLNLWYQHADQRKQEEIRGYANNDFAQLLKACGFDKAPVNALELQGKILTCKVGIEPERDDSGYGDSNKILRFIKSENVSAPKPASLPPSMSDESPEESDVEDATPKPPKLS